jgi:hypothetical protein
VRSPQWCTVPRPEKLDAHPQAISGRLHRAGQEIAHLEGAPDLAGIGILTGIPEHGAGRTEPHLLHPGKARNDGVRYSYGENAGIRSAAEGAEWKNGQGNRPSRLCESMPTGQVVCSRE